MTRDKTLGMLIAATSLIAACVLTYVALNHLPYRYYQFVRIGATLSLISSAYFFFERGSSALVIGSIFFALVFIFYKGHRSNWITIDIVSAAILLVPVLIIGYEYVSKMKAQKN